MFSFFSIGKKTKYLRHLLRSRMTIKYVQFSLLIKFILMISVIGIEILLDQTVLQFKDHQLLLFQIPILGLMLIIILFSFILLFIIGRYLRRLIKKEKSFDEIVTQGESNRNTESSYGSRGKLEHHLSKRIDHVMSSVEFRGTSELNYSPLCDRRNSLPFERVPHKESENNHGSSGEHPIELSNNTWMPPRKKSIEGKQKRAKLGIENDNDTEENDQNIHESLIDSMSDPTLYSSNEGEYYDISPHNISIHPELRQHHSPVQQNEQRRRSPDLTTPLLAQNQHIYYFDEPSESREKIRKHLQIITLLRSVIILLICIFAQIIMCLFSITIFTHQDGFLLLHLFVTIMILNVWTPVPIVSTIALTMGMIVVMFLGFTFFPHESELLNTFANNGWIPAAIGTGCSFVFFTSANYFMHWHNKNAFFFSENRRKQIQQMKKEEDDNQALLGSILPRVIIKRLQLRPDLNFDRIIEGSVLFAYLSLPSKEYYHISLKEEIITFSFIFSKFDTMCDRYKVLNIKSIGNTFMAVSGCPHYQSRFAQNIALLAFAMIEKATPQVKHDSLWRFPSSSTLIRNTHIQMACSRCFELFRLPSSVKHDR
eukprot:gb/GECH01010603.1/.p1 GENE.gb/GECH01010603.1/~~gb/GECH01010603.1/.p1  ORF type:complete len:597 (+),score=74.50 gb/GECH01010603.1/:1-1791(+)